jgi:hypothetical protein
MRENILPRHSRGLTRGDGWRGGHALVAQYRQLADRLTADLGGVLSPRLMRVCHLPTEIAGTRMKLKGLLIVCLFFSLPLAAQV